MIAVERRSELPVPADRAWQWATSPEGVNAELRPLLRMTMPARVRGVPLDQFPVGTPAGRSWILLFGLIPVDYDDLRLTELEPPRRFLERSRTLSFDPWIHERTIEPVASDCTVSDRLEFELRPALRRVPGAAALARTIVGAVFSHRHRRLRRRAARPLGRFGR